MTPPLSHDSEVRPPPHATPLRGGGVTRLDDDAARANAKILEENEETGSKKYKYIKTGINHYSFAFTYGVMAAESVTLPMSPEQLRYLQSVIDSMYS